MVETTLFAGRVRKWTLSLIQGKPGPDAPALKRLALPQGQLDQIHNSDEGIRYLAVLELIPGTVRGNHHHAIKQEYVYVIEGELLLLLEDPQSRQRERLSLQAGDLAHIPPGIAHALQTVAPGRAIEFSPTQFDATDSTPYSVIPSS